MRWTPDKVKVKNVEIDWQQIDMAVLGDVYKFSPDGPPLAKTVAKFELIGTPRPVANAVRRALIDETPGLRLTFGDISSSGLDYESTTDPFMSDSFFLRERFKSIRLRPHIPDEIVKRLTFSLNVTNESAEVCEVFTDHLIPSENFGAPIMNPHIIIGFLQPARTLKIDGIKFERGVGTEHATFNNACHVAMRPLGLEEWTTEETHSKDGVAAAMSRYKQSALTTDPKHHLLTAVVPAHPNDEIATKLVIADVCDNIIRRLKRVSTSIKSDGLIVIDTEIGATGMYKSPNETSTIGEMLQWSILNRNPGIVNVSYTAHPHERMIVLTVTDKIPLDGARVAFSGLIIDSVADMVSAVEKIKTAFA